MAAVRYRVSPQHPPPPPQGHTSFTPYGILLKTAHLPENKYYVVFSTQVGTGRLADHTAARAVGPVHDGQARQA